MTAPIARGFRTLRSSDVHIDRWLMSMDEQAPIDLPDLLEDWTSARDLTIALRFALDFAAAHERLGLHVSAHLAAAIQWYSPETGLSGTSSPKRLVGDSTSLEFTVDGRLIGGRLDLQSEIVLLDAGIRSGDSRAPWEPGSILWRARESVILEGDASRMRVEAHSFKSSSIVRGENAIWYLNVDHREYDAPVGSSLTLWINSDNDAGRTVLDSSGSEREVVLKLILSGVSRQIADIGLTDPDFDLETQYPVGSLGASIQNVLSAMEVPLAELKRLRDEDPAALDAQIQSHAWSLV